VRSAPDRLRYYAGRFPTVEIDAALKIFDPRTRQGLQGTAVGLGDTLAGRRELRIELDALRHLGLAIGALADVPPDDADAGVARKTFA